MEITHEGLDWSDDDVLNLRAFLKTRTGTRMLPKMLEMLPVLLGDGEINKILIRTGEVRGFQDAARQILALAYPPNELPKEQPKNYPDLTDDSAWSDGMKIQPQ